MFMASVFIMCNPLMDLIIPAPADLIKELGAVKGSMNLVEFPIIENILSKGLSYTRVPGGSGANTARGLAWLRGNDGRIERPYFLGAVGRDEEGRMFHELLERGGVGSLLSVKTGFPTGVSAILVTPDHERTMFTCLSACRLLETKDIPIGQLRESSYVYVTGYNWDTPNQESAVKAVVEEARTVGRKVCLDVADPFVAHRYRGALAEWIPGRVDVLFANREELRALTALEGTDEAVLKAAGKLAPLVVMKIGKDGCLIFDGKSPILVPGEQVVPVDTTAAGDSFAAGFLFGLLLGKDLAQCGGLANRTASRMVTVQGCNYDLLDRDEVLAFL
jgi:sugar/nucleoside kinase (ribokinase family)